MSDKEMAGRVGGNPVMFEVTARVERMRFQVVEAIESHNQELAAQVGQAMDRAIERSLSDLPQQIDNQVQSLIQGTVRDAIEAEFKNWHVYDVVREALSQTDFRDAVRTAAIHCIKKIAADMEAKDV